MQKNPTTGIRNTNPKSDSYPSQAKSNDFNFSYKSSQKKQVPGIKAPNFQISDSDYSLYSEILNDAESRKANIRDSKDTNSREKATYLDNFHDDSYPYQEDFLQMEAESVGARQVQNRADKAMSAEELSRLHKRPPQTSQSEMKQVPIPDKQAPVQKKEAHISIRPAVSVEGMSLSRDVLAARKKLADFNLEGLVMTKKDVFDMRYNSTKEFLAQCSAAEMDPIDYYYENINKSREEETVVNKKIDVRNQVEVKKEKVPVKESREEEIRRKMAEAKRQLDEIVEIKGLQRTKNGDLDRRFKANKDYFELEAQTKESYYQ